MLTIVERFAGEEVVDQMGGSAREPGRGKLFGPGSAGHALWSRTGRGEGSGSAGFAGTVAEDGA